MSKHHEQKIYVKNSHWRQTQTNMVVVIVVIFIIVLIVNVVHHCVYIIILLILIIILTQDNFIIIIHWIHNNNNKNECKKDREWEKEEHIQTIMCLWLWHHNHYIKWQLVKVTRGGCDVGDDGLSPGDTKIQRH